MRWIMNKFFFLLIIILLSTINYSIEFIFVQYIGSITSNDLLSINLTLGSFLLSLGIGSLYYSKKNINDSDLIQFQALLMGILLPISLILLQKIHILNNVYYLSFVKNLSTEIPFKIFQGYDLPTETFTLKILLIPFIKNAPINFSIIIISSLLGFLSGIELPFLISFGKTFNIKQNTILGINFIGSSVSAFILIFYLKNKFSVQQLFLFFGFTYLLLGLTTHLKFYNKRNLIINIIIIVLISKYAGQLKQYSLSLNSKINESFYSSKEFVSIEETKTPYQIIHKVKFPDTIGLYLNNQYQLRLDNEYYYHETMTFVPLYLLNKKPDNILILGAGDGFILRELFKYDLFHIDHIELDQEFLFFCKSDKDIAKANNNSLNKKINTLTFNDAFFELQHLQKKYDLIIIDFPHPHSYDLAKLYSVEFFKLLKNRLSQNGLAVMDVPIQNSNHIIQNKALDFGSINNDIIYSTIKDANFKTNLFYSIASDGFVILSNKIYEKPKDINYKNFILNNNTKELFKLLPSEEIPMNYDKHKINSIFLPKKFYFKE